MNGIKKVCVNCFGNAHYLLSNNLLKTKIDFCSFCSNYEETISFHDLVEKVCTTIIERFEVVDDKEIHFVDSPQHLIEVLLSASEDAPFMVELVDCISKGNYQSYPHFQVGARLIEKKVESQDVVEDWLEFIEHLKHGNRFFNSKAKTFLDSVFVNAKYLRQSSTGNGLLYTIDEHYIYRGRKFFTHDDLLKIKESPQTELSFPPKTLATSGRMNPHGVPVFYGAFDRPTCIAELKPYVGERIVTGRFKLTGPLTVMDFTRLDSTSFIKQADYFDPEYVNKMGMLHFLRDLHKKIGEPVLPQNNIDYLIPQVISEYLTSVFDPPIDALLFSSTQKKSGTNFVIFQRAINIGGAKLEFMDDSLSVHHIDNVEYQWSETQE